MSHTNIMDSCIPNRQEQLEIWERLPLTAEQRIRVIEAMREEANSSDTSEAKIDSDSDEGQMEAPRDEAQAEAEVEKTAVDK